MRSRCDSHVHEKKKEMNARRTATKQRHGTRTGRLELTEPHRRPKERTKTKKRGTHNKPGPEKRKEKSSLTCATAMEGVVKEGTKSRAEERQRIRIPKRATESYTKKKERGCEVGETVRRKLTGGGRLPKNGAAASEIESRNKGNYDKSRIVVYDRRVET